MPARCWAELAKVPHRSTQRKVAGAADNEAALTGAIVELAREYGRYGYRRVTALLRAEGWSCNHKAATDVDKKSVQVA